MKKLLITICLLGWYTISIAQVTSDALLKYKYSVVRVGYVGKTGMSYGQGFIAGQRGDSIFIVTAAHVLHGDKYDNTVYDIVLFPDSSTCKASILYQGKSHVLQDDIAILAVKKPDHYAWPKVKDNKNRLNVEMNLFFINNRDISNIQFEDTSANALNYDSTKTFTVYLPSVKRGDSGSAIWRGGDIGIAGMLSQSKFDGTGLCDAIGMCTIRAIFRKYCKMEIFN
ncbi:trypsin-like peptidase domain-containing protein [Mucilaginibacter sp. E4BP6]|uniref:trypsin-like peptidase domain-containing protein n=1 Tax=Mucilaginibacter sp. E4BP6 TaxID=2723089 RepID=UPI0015CD19AF|nr:trypsin-like peptidase domain-containing protein [Mucilaginibacter sp. E4BP6]NYE68162.1 hypothetical protein [Mucilaginibacter sp. E4BP6]